MLENTKGNCEQTGLSAAVCLALLHSAQCMLIHPNSQSIILKIEFYYSLTSRKPEFYIITRKYSLKSEKFGPIY